MPDSLTSTVTTGHGMLRGLLADTTYVAFPRLARDQQVRADAFLIAACRHVSAVSNVLVDELTRSGDRAGACLIAQQCHDLQVAMLRAKGRLYGSGLLARVPWHTVWSDVVDRFEELTSTEQTMVAGLSSGLDPHALDALARRLCMLENRAPTRPHPNLPRGRLGGRVTQAIVGFADGIWDGVEGRCAPPSTPFTQG